MKKKKRLLLIIGIIVLLVLISGIVFMHFNNKKEAEEKERLIATSKFTITYTYGGGFGTIATTATKEITIDQDGNIIFRAPKYEEDIEPVTYKISKTQAKTLYSLLMSYGFLDLKEDLSQDGVTDAGSSYVEIKSDNFDKKVGGYAAFLNKKYSKLTSEIIKVVGQNRIKSFDEIVIQKLENSDC